MSDENEYYAVNDRPVKVVVLPNGGGDIFVFDFTTGGFVPDRSYWEHVDRLDPFKDVDTLTKEQFDDIVHRLRTRVIAKHVTSPITWETTDDAEVPFKATINGHAFTLRLNDFPAEPMYTLIVGGEEIADLEDWPEAWQRPGGFPTKPKG